MVRLLLGPGLLGGFLFLFWLWALIDVVLTDSMLIRNMQKSTWLFLVIFVPTIGAAAWIFFGRPEGATAAPGGAIRYEANPHRSDRTSPPGRRSGGVRGIEDSPGWSRPRSTPSRPAGLEVGEDGESPAVLQRKLMEKEAELAKREAALQAQEQQSPAEEDEERPDPEDV